MLVCTAPTTTATLPAFSVEAAELPAGYNPPVPDSLRATVSGSPAPGGEAESRVTTAQGIAMSEGHEHGTTGGQPKSAPVPASEPAAANPTEEKRQKPGSATGAAEGTPVMVAIESLRHEMTEEEKAEEERRWKAIRAGRHPDTGERLKRADEKSLKPMERYWLKMQRERSIYTTSWAAQVNTDLMIAQERERVLKSSIYGTSHWSSLRSPIYDFQMHELADRRLDRSLIQNQIDPLISQAAIDAACGPAAARREYNQIGQLDYRQRFLDPLFDSVFVNRITGGINSELMQRAAERNEQEAIRALSDQVRTAATIGISNLWNDAAQFHWRAEVAATRDATMMAAEAGRLLSIYGPRIADESAFLIEYQRNLPLFAPGLTVSAQERADLLARIALPAIMASPLDAYLAESRVRFGAYAEALLAQLEADFAREGNHVFVWQGYLVARRYGIDVPEWVQDQMDNYADGIVELLEQVESGKPIGKESVKVGQTLGFGLQGQGGTGLFARAVQQSTDREIYFEVEDRLEEEQAKWPDRNPKLTSIYAEVGAKLGRDASTVRRAYQRMKRFIGKPEEHGD